MSVGIFDNDLIYLGIPILNLEAMKYSSYFKKKKEIVSLSRTFPNDRFSKMILRKDYNDGIFLHDIEQEVLCGGLAYTDGEYKALPMEIEMQQPDTLLYESYVETLPIELQRPLKTQLRAQHGRISINGKEYWSQFMCQFSDLSTRLYYFHDFNITSIKGSYEALCEFVKKIKHRAPSFHFKFPLVFNNMEDFRKWSSLPFSASLTDLILNFYPTAEEIRQNLDLFNYTKLYINIQCAPQDFVFEAKNILNFALIFRTFRKKILLNYEGTLKPEEEMFLKLVNGYLHADTSKVSDERLLDDTFFKYTKDICSKTKKKLQGSLNRRDCRKIYEYFSKENLEVFNAFYLATANNLMEENNG